jgi:hypothetical protein
MYEFNVFNTIIVNKVAVVCIGWLKLWQLNCNAQNEYKKIKNV